MKPRRLIAMLLALSLMLGCSSGETAAPTAAPAETKSEASTTGATQDDVTVLQFAVSSAGQARYEALVETFEAENPGVMISLVSTEEVLGIRAGETWPENGYLLLASAADVIDATATRDAVAQGALLDLATFFQSDPNLSLDGFYPNMIECVSYDGGVWSVPVQGTYTLINYDKTRFDTAGVDYPQPGWSWDDFLAVAQQLTVSDGDAVTQWGFTESPVDPAALIQAQAGLLFDPDMSPPLAKLDTQAVVDATTWYCDLYLTHEVAPYVSSTEAAQAGPGAPGAGPNRQVLNQGAPAAMSTGSLSSGMQRNRPGQDQTQQGVAPFPIAQSDDHSTPLSVSGLSISAGTAQADLAWKWVSFLAQQANLARAFGSSAGRIAAMPQVAASSGYWDNLDEDTTAVMQYVLEHSYVDTYTGSGTDALDDAITAVIESGSTVAKALEDAQTIATDDIDAEAEAAPTPVADLVVADSMQNALNAGAVVIEFGTGSTGGRGGFSQQSYNTLIDEFQTLHPDILVEIKTVQNFRGTMSLADMAAEYDCFVTTPNYSEESLAAIVSMEPLVSADPDLAKSDFYDALMKQFTYQGQLWGIPGTATIKVINYNKDLFDAADVAYPTEDWSTAEFLATAVALTQGEDETAQYGYAPSGSEIDDLISFMDRLGVSIVNDSLDPVGFEVNTAEAIKTMRWFTSLTTQYGVTPDVESTINQAGMGGRNQMQTFVRQGDVGMWTNAGLMGSGTMPGQENATEINVGAAPLPMGPNSEQGSGFQTVNGYFISSQAENRQACWEWIAFLTEHSISTSGLPARRSTAESDAYRQAVGDELADAYIASVSTGSEASFFQQASDQASWLQFSTRFISTAYDQIVDEEVTVEQAMADAQESLDAFRDCVITSDEIDDMTAVRECYTSVSQ